MRWTVVLVVGVLIAAGPEDDKFVSENKATSVRPPLPRANKPGTPVAKAPRPAAAEKPADTDTKAINADDVKAVAALEGKEAKVRGTVHSTFSPPSDKLLILNLGKNFRQCVKVSISSRSFAKWDGGKDGIERMYKGKTITVEGPVKLFNKLPEITVNLPSQIQVE
jgi:hypothetical protein